jgi:hypothetical protein
MKPTSPRTGASAQVSTFCLCRAGCPLTTAVPHGGFVSSILMAAVAEHFGRTLPTQSQPHTVALHVDFLRRTAPGPAHVRIRPLKLGSRTSVVHAELTQGTRTCAVATLTQTHLEHEEGLSLASFWALEPAPAPVDLDALAGPEGRDAAWTRAPVPHAALRHALQHVHWFMPRAAQPATNASDVWLCLADGADWTNIAIGYLADVFPLPVERLTRASTAASASPNVSGVYWYPTLCLNLDIKRLLRPGCKWLFSRSTVKQVRNGRMDIEVVLLDAHGDLVALSNHVAFVLDVQRNLAPRELGVGEPRL